MTLWLKLFRVKAHKMMAGEGVYIWIILALMMNFVMRSSARDFSLVGYLPEWRHEGADFDRLSSHLSHLILFSAEVFIMGGAEAQKPKTFRIAAFYAQNFSGRSARIHFSRHIKKRVVLSHDISKKCVTLSRH